MNNHSHTPFMNLLQEGTMGALRSTHRWITETTRCYVTESTHRSSCSAVSMFMTSFMWCASRTSRFWSSSFVSSRPRATPSCCTQNSRSTLMMFNGFVSGCDQFDQKTDQHTFETLFIYWSCCRHLVLFWSTYRMNLDFVQSADKSAEQICGISVEPLGSRVQSAWHFRS